MPGASHLTAAKRSLGSDGAMSASTLSESVLAARTAKRMTASRLQSVTGLSARTIRDIESGNPLRRYGPTTLARLDGPLGWPPGRAWQLWNEQGAGDVAEVQRSIDDLARRLMALETEPPWGRELIDVVSQLEPADRSRVFDLARRLAAG